MRNSNLKAIYQYLIDEIPDKQISELNNLLQDYLVNGQVIDYHSENLPIVKFYSKEKEEGLREILIEHISSHWYDYGYNSEMEAFQDFGFSKEEYEEMFSKENSEEMDIGN